MPTLSPVFIRSSQTGKYLTLQKVNKDGDRTITATNANLSVWKHPENKYLWVIDTYYGIIRSAEDYFLCIDVITNRITKETSLAANIFDCYNLLSSQKWRIDTRRNVVSSKDNEYVMDLTSDKGRVCIWPYHGGVHQMFSVLQIKYDQPTFRIVDVQTLRVLHVSDDGTVLLSEDIDNPSSIWSYIYNNVIVCVQHPGKVLSVEAGYLTIDTPEVGNNYQGWTLNLRDEIFCQYKPGIRLRTSSITGKVITFDKTVEYEYNRQHFKITFC